MSKKKVREDEGVFGTTMNLNESIPFIENHIMMHKTVMEKYAHAGEIRYSALCVSGPPGIGKSDLAEQICHNLTERGYPTALTVYYMATMQLEQLTGLPKAGSAAEKQFHRWFAKSLEGLKKRDDIELLGPLAQIVKDLPEYVVQEEPAYTQWSLPELFSFRNIRYVPRDDQGKTTFSWDTDTMVLMLDDIHLLNKTMQSYLFQLLTYRSINSHHLPKNVVLVMAGNRSTDRAGFQQMLAPITNRIDFIDVQSNIDDWINNFAIGYGVRTDIVMFLQNCPEYLSSTPRENEPWASPRSWTYASDKLNHFEEWVNKVDMSQIYTIMKGHVGTEFAGKFYEYKSLMLEWNAPELLEGRGIPVISNLNQMEMYSIMTVMIDETLKRMRREQKIEKVHMKSLKKVLEGVTEKCRPIVPLGVKVLMKGNKKAGSAQLTRQLIDSSDIIKKITEVV
jgi:GTPase SAR1 family protein